MKNTLFLFLFLLTANISSFGQTTVDSQISTVKVFKRNAQITRQASFKAAPSTQQIVLTGISTQMVPSSLQIQFDNPNVTLLSAKYENNFLQHEKNDPVTTNLQQQLDDLADQLALIADKKSSLQGMENILNKNQDLGGSNTSFTPQQVIELSNAYQTKYLEIKAALRTLRKQEKPIKEQINQIKKQLNENNAKNNAPSGNIVLQITTKTTQSVHIECKYMVNNAGWNPLYDLRSAGITENIQLSYKANIYQSTGVEWKDVNIIVSTGNTSQNNNRPILNPLYARVYNYSNQVQAYSQQKSINRSNMALEQDDDFIETQVQENQLTVDFDITNKQTIASDGKQNLVALNTYELTTEYIYHSVPKLNKGAFLLAKIKDWSNYNLIAGQANIFFEGAFVGTSHINPQVTSNSLLISMGRDNSIVVERLAIKEYTASKYIGTNKRETFGYEIIVKNKKSTPIKIEILDQIPVSQDKTIEVELEEKGSAEYTPTNGKLLWTLDIQARETQKEKFVYTVKYPKKSSVIGIQ